MERYFKIQNTQDGMSINTIEDIDEFLNECIDEDIEFVKDLFDCRYSESKILESSGENSLAENQYLIIKGKICLPKKKEVVTKYEL